MRFAFTDEQEMLREAVAGALARDLPLARVREVLACGDQTPVRALHRAGGWTGIGVDEDLGGQGGGVVEQAILAQELGRAAAPGSLPIAGCLAAALLAGGDTPEADDVRSLLCDGTAAVVVAIAAGRDAGTGLEVRDGRLSGEVPAVLGAPEADVLLAAVDGAVYEVAVADPGCDVVAHAFVDPGRTIADVRFDVAPARRLGAASADDLDRLTDLGAVLIAAEALGAAGRLLDLTVAYAQQREQFGAPIGSFQAVKHIAADMLVDVETAHSAVYHAAWAHERADPQQAAAAVSIAKSFATTATARVADAALAVHGAVGFTWEHDLHLFLKRAHSATSLYGSAGAHRERLARSLNLVAETSAVTA